jgi:hypothetical protein
MRRLFFGLEIPGQIKARLLKARAEVSCAKWQSVEQMHNTLLFHGDVEEEPLLAACEAAHHIPLAAFELNVTGLGCFGLPRAPRKPGQIYFSSTASSPWAFSSPSVFDIFGGGGVQAFNSCPAS